MDLRPFVACLAILGSCRVAPPPSELGRAAPFASRLGRDAVDGLAVKKPRPKPPSVPTSMGPLECQARWETLSHAPAAPGTPGLDASRAELLARTKGEPLVFVRAPAHAPSKSAPVRGYRRALESARFPWDWVGRIDERLRYTPRIARQVFLKSGYLYAERPDLGVALADRMKLDHLFDEPRLSIERGSERLEVTRDRKRGYLYASGPDSGKPARLLLFDRVGVVGEDLGPNIGRDVRTLAHELGFERMKIVRISDEHILTELRYGSVWVKSVLRSEGPRVSLECEIPPPQGNDSLARERHRIAKRERVLSAFRSSMLAQIEDELPFDEPRREWGQQDGHLRFHWLLAYTNNEDHYFFNNDRYPVFTPKGQPAPPQVCIDFITETLERATGTHFRPRGVKPGRERGGVDFDELLGPRRRQVTTFLDYAKERKDLFEFESLSVKNQTPFTFKHQFYRHLARDANLYPPGTIVVIRGYAPWDFFSVPHYHTFFVYESDPVTGVPMLLSGNAGKPRVQTWESVMSRAPGRAIRFRIHPKIDWWAGVVREPKTPSSAAPPLLAMF